MSHHFDYPQDETLDISDAYCFAGPGDLHGPRTVFGMNTSPFGAPTWNAAGYYELKIDTNGDYVLTGAAATDRTVSGTIITPSNAPVGQVVECSNGIKLFAGPRLDPFRNFIPYPVTTTNSLAAGTFPDFPSLGPAHNDFANTAVRSYVLEVPVAITGRGRVHFWASTAYFDTGHNTWVQTQRAGKPNMTTFFEFDTGSAKVSDYNSTAPTIDLVGRPRHPAIDPASGIWGQVRDRIAAVVEAGGTYDNRPHKFPTARAYGAWAADALLPNVIAFTLLGARTGTGPRLLPLPLPSAGQLTRQPALHHSPDGPSRVGTAACRFHEPRQVHARRSVPALRRAVVAWPSIESLRPPHGPQNRAGGLPAFDLGNSRIATP
jgi:hypothetical protein